jgi:hypothetical protein
MTSGRWRECTKFEDEAMRRFVQEYFGRADRSILLVAAAGFDERSTVIPGVLANAAAARTRLIALREERRRPDAELVASGDANLAGLQRAFPNTEVIQFEIFADDLAVIGGRRIVRDLSRVDLTGVTHIVLDVSALSVGVYYPAFALLFEIAKTHKINLQVAFALSPRHDDDVDLTFSDKVGHPHGFGFEFEMLTTRRPNEGRLWLPQLARGGRPALDLIHQSIEPDDVCPILPFPAVDPRAADIMADHFVNEIEGDWGGELGQMIRASDSNPLDLYRSVVRLNDERRHLFGDNPSTLILTPMQSKAPGVGMLLSAVELQLPVVYVESASYKRRNRAAGIEPRLILLWVHGPVDET